MRQSNRPREYKNDFAILEPRTKHVPADKVRKSWMKLPLSSHVEIQDLIMTAKEQSRQRKSRRKLYKPTEECVEEVADKLTQSLKRIPFPPKTEDSHFHHEANLHRIRKIEEQLTLNIHSMELLQSQILEEEKQLKQEEAELEYLERSLQSNEIFRRQQSRSIHPSARSLIEDSDDIDLLMLDKMKANEPEISISDLFQDPALGPVLELLTNHLDNLENNVVDIKRVIRAAEVTSSRLRSLTWARFSKKTSYHAAGQLSSNQT